MFINTKEMNGSKFGNQTFSCLLCGSLTHWIGDIAQTFRSENEWLVLLKWRETSSVYIIPLCVNVSRFYLKKILMPAKPPVRRISFDITCPRSVVIFRLFINQVRDITIGNFKILHNEPETIFLININLH